MGDPQPSSTPGRATAPVRTQLNDSMVVGWPFPPGEDRLKVESDDRPKGLGPASS
jgi:hypothetical protein